ncbi:hypothetical protein T190607A01A_30474 [Tenacibaculum sp. 190524A05c]|uniref:Uncharacterized protein n=1 Tax=Tenacibaculum platacis TaxID=3137852 RepID=A0ABP1ESI5_9FLAO
MWRNWRNLASRGNRIWNFGELCMFLNLIVLKKSILNFGKALSKAEQNKINGGTRECRVLPWCSGLDNYIIIQCRCYQQPF